MSALVFRFWKIASSLPFVSGSITCAESTIGVNGSGRGIGEVVDWARTRNDRAGRNKNRNRTTTSRRRALPDGRSLAERSRFLLKFKAAVLAFYQLMQDIKKSHTNKNDNRDHRVSLFFVIHFRYQVASGDVKRDAC